MTVIIGGGLAGLSAAFYTLKKNPRQQLKLLEATNHLGGWIRSRQPENGVVFEQGPRTIRPRGIPGANTLQLLEELHLEDAIRPIFASHPAAKNRMILTGNQLHLLPSSIGGIFKKQQPFSKPLIRFLIQDLYAKSIANSNGDESIHSFVSRRFGQEVADYLIAPLICGICAGDSREISVKFLMKTMFEYEQKFGSISGGFVRSFFDKKTDREHLRGLALRAKNERWSIYSLQNGVETLAKGLKKAIENQTDINIGSACQELTFSNNKVELILDNSTINTDKLISSIPANQLAKLLNRQHPDLANMLYKIPFATVVVVNLHYHGTYIKSPGFGFLVPPKENRPILGVVFDSCCFASPNDTTVLTVMMGGAYFDKYFSQSTTQSEFLNIAKAELKNIIGIEAEPVNYRVNILKNAIPQYIVGHEQNLSNIFNYIKNKNMPLYLCGASYFGVGVNDVILGARKVVDRFF